ncbi:MAG: putative nucleotidyltransferase [Bacteroidia bacterium]|jgi:predicted nucleotidyltransferase
MDFLQKHTSSIKNICTKHQVVKLYAFGSIVRNELTPDSDIDLIVQFSDVPLIDYADNYFALCEAFETLFERSVDVIVDRSITNPYFREELEETKELLFAA